MAIDIGFSSVGSAEQGMIVVFVDNKKQLFSAAARLNEQLDGWVQRCIDVEVGFKGKAGECFVAPMVQDDPYNRLMVVSMGDVDTLDLKKVDEMGGKFYKALKASGASHVSIYVDTPDHDHFVNEDFAARIAYGISLAAYEYVKYKSVPEDNEAEGDLVLDFVLEEADAARKDFEHLSAVVQGVYLARDLVNDPPNDLHPVSYAALIRDELEPLGVKIEVIDEKKMAKLGMDAILNVGMGTAMDRQPRMVIMRYYGAGKPTKKAIADDPSLRPISFIGKGVTFDTGGISLKPGAEMDLMKMDMGGSATVVGLMKALATRQAKVNVVCAVGLAENMPSDRAYRPGDIIGSLAGKTIEVLNTDAEGRLVLADTMTYVQEKDDPKVMIDLATLTGAMMVALGFEYSGVFANNNELWSQLEEASDVTGEKLWRMPLDEAYRKEVESDIADLRNLGNLGRYGGACSAAGFLEHFVDKGRVWAHMDIAGTAWNKSAKTLCPKGGSGVAVRALHEMVSRHYEK